MGAPSKVEDNVDSRPLGRRVQLLPSALPQCYSLEPENSKTTKRELIHCFQRSTRIEADKRERGGKGRPYCDDGQSTA